MSGATVLRWEPPEPAGRGHAHVPPSPVVPVGALRVAVEPEVLSRLPVPWPARRQVDTAAADDLDDGPQVPDVLYWLYRVKQLVHTAEELGDCGAGARHAALVLGAAVQRAVPEPGPHRVPRPHRAAIGRLAWAHAVCGVRCEITICAERAAATPRGHRRADLLELARRSDELFQQMARTPSFAAWYATVDPLYRSWLGGSLSRATAPPALFPHSTALYRARPELTLGWNPADERLSPDDDLPLGSLERYVHDATGARWAVILAAPGGVDDARDWPEPSGAVVAAGVASDGSGARCYLLAESVVPRQAMPLIHQSGGHDRLEDLAASVAGWRQQPLAVWGG